jgi:hypothetical protein
MKAEIEAAQDRADAALERLQQRVEMQLASAEDEADEAAADHRDNINRAREQADGLRRGMGLGED